MYIFEQFQNLKIIIKVHSLAFGRFLLEYKPAETVLQHFHILQETINRFVCPLILFLKSETHQLNLKDVIKLNRNLTVTNGDKIDAG